MISFTYTTGIHYTDKAVEWVVMRKSRRGVEKLREGSIAIPDDFFSREDTPLFPAEVLPKIRHSFSGVITVSLPSSKLLMRIIELPSTDPEELSGMVELQIDSLSPFAVDQLTVSYEVFHQADGRSRVLAVAAPRKTVDALGDLFKEQNVYIRSLDAEVLAWWTLLVTHGQLQSEGRVVLILEEHTEFSMIVVDDNVPIWIRSLELFHDFQDESVMQEIADEIGYTLLALEAEYGPRDIAEILFWSESEIPQKFCELLRSQCGAEVSLHDLRSIPPVSEGLALRSAERRLHHVELIPGEWVDLQHRRQLMKISVAATIAVLGVWLAVVAVTGTVFSIRQIGLNRVRKEADKYAVPARAAQDAREEMLSLEKYADRSHSALECLREITVNMPAGIEITSFTYKKGGAVSLRGSGDRADIIYDYFQNLGSSELFEGVKDQPVNTRTVKGRRISTFSITAELPEIAGEGGP
jgi:hypothetical protein